MTKNYLFIVLAVIALMINLQLFSQTKITYHERFFDNRMKWSVFEDEEKGMALIDTIEGFYFIENYTGDEEVFAKAAINFSTAYGFSFSYHTINSWGSVSVSGNGVKFSFELLDEKYRVNYTKSGIYKLGKWKKIKKTPFNAPEADAVLKIEYKNKNFKFYVNNVFTADFSAAKLKMPTQLDYIEIGTSMDMEISDVFINGHVFLKEYQAFLKGEGISEEELEKKKFFSVKDALKNPKQVYKLKIEKYDFAWDEDLLPEEIFSCIYLQQVEIDVRDKGDFAKIIEQLQNFQSLQVLNLLIDSVPETIAKLKNLRKLVAGNWTNISTTALKNICTLNKLTHLDLGTDEPYGYVPVEGLKNIGNLTELEHLDLSFCDLGVIPESIYGLTNLKTLDIGGNNLGTLPDDFSKLNKLEYLYINDNLWGTVPEVVFTLSKLKQLDLTRNNLNSFPESLSRLKNLEYLDLYANDFETIPKSVYKLYKLTDLNFSHNQLKYIGEDIGNLSKLETLNFYANNLNSLPVSIAKLKNLNELSIGKCKVTEIPEQYFTLKNLNYFSISGNFTKEEIKRIEKKFSYVKSLYVFQIN